MGPLGLIDGRVIDLDEKIVRMEDRGHQFGDGAYEVTKVYNGKLFAYEPHLARLERSLQELRIPLEYSMIDLVRFHELLIEKSEIKEGNIYLQVTRGTAPRVHNFPGTVKSCLTMSIRPSGSNTELREKGVKAITVPDERWLRCDIKSLNLLGNVLAKQQAKEAGFYEAILVRDGYLTEGSSSNFYAIKDGEIWTHPVNNLILNGITRKIVIDIARSLNIKVIETPFTVEFAQSCDETFLTSTTNEVMPVIGVGSKKINNGIVGPVTRKLQQAYTNKVDTECQWVG
ncbi:MAG: D-amino-acid transaminase [Desulfosporosinus sp.]|nr:D-amino-acid transaminase [Desulfosporosinus sp.]